MAHTQKVLLLLLVFFTLLTVCVGRSRRINCTRFVYAPRCRGVAAKRGGDRSDLNDALNDPLLSSREAGEEEEGVRVRESNLRELTRMSRLLRALLSRPEGDAERGTELTSREQWL
ncbi:elevenin-like [Babylonia areolata]|uniref:elevenin-like n=1 Tax=Babylonia areolata TaxID=304850 RepID=UPI003FD2DFDC